MMQNVRSAGVTVTYFLVFLLWVYRDSAQLSASEWLVREGLNPLQLWGQEPCGCKTTKKVHRDEGARQ